MPKEKIYDQSSCWDVVVGWTPEPTGEVQVGLDSVDGLAIVDRLYGDEDVLAAIAAQLHDGHIIREYAVTYGRKVLDAVITAGYDPSGSYTSIWASLNREGCNRHIRHLRRARDAAYGKDE